MSAAERTALTGTALSTTGAYGDQGRPASDAGSSIIRLDGSSDSVTADVGGASELALGALEVTNMEIDLSGASNAEVNVTGTLSASASGASELLYEGDPSIERSETSGSSSINPR